MLPDWLSIKPASTEKYGEIKQQITSLGLHTVCVEAHCPNASECWGAGTATFMILGDLCTRGCTFCAVRKSAKGSVIDLNEPEKLAKIVKKWGLDYIVITSVCRDDLPDQGSGHFARCVTEIKKENPNTLVEVLVPDFRNDGECLKRIAESKPHVIGHNLETVERLTLAARDRRASYRQSLDVLRNFKQIDNSLYTKSAMMLGIGEQEEEVVRAMKDLRASGVDFLAIGQYLRPSQHHIEVKEYVRPETFEHFREIGLSLGFRYVAAGPFVRSSYKAGEFFIKSVVKSS
ncbi:MAG: lipoyl synthase, partial [Candidatus Micrarchaeota archaeon]|nr:lipoyl synthase [Candidatus Micrarchaeota archaeon]